ncbi:hypothetical protein AB1Y20_018620 [Prymnesium parvum]|uniref:Cyclic nucleotide-binding domain-containing protein n=1 Tax=Prymnesium parvum TaxID=97485 RepID=A0AB34JSB8_PRYPA
MELLILAYALPSETSPAKTAVLGWLKLRNAKHCAHSPVYATPVPPDGLIDWPEEWATYLRPGELCSSPCSRSSLCFRNGSKPTAQSPSSYVYPRTPSTPVDSNEAPAEEAAQQMRTSEREPRKVGITLPKASRGTAGREAPEGYEAGPATSFTPSEGTSRADRSPRGSGKLDVKQFTLRGDVTPSDFMKEMIRQQVLQTQTMIQMHATLVKVAPAAGGAESTKEVVQQYFQECSRLADSHAPPQKGNSLQSKGEALIKYLNSGSSDAESAKDIVEQYMKEFWNQLGESGAQPGNSSLKTNSNQVIEHTVPETIVKRLSDPKRSSSSITPEDDSVSALPVSSIARINSMPFTPESNDSSDDCAAESTRSSPVPLPRNTYDISNIGKNQPPPKLPWWAKILDYCTCLPVLDRNSWTVLYWNSLIGVCVAYVAIYVPVQAAFDELNKPEEVWQAVNLTIDFLFLLDVGKVFNISIDMGGVWVYNRVLIAQAYLKNGFWLDFFAALPYALIVSAATGGNTGDLVVVRLLRLLRLIRVVIKLTRNSNSVTEAVSGGRFRFNPALARVVQLVCMLILTCHWAGCMWWLVGTLERDEHWQTDGREDTWGPNPWLLEEPISLRYLHGFNWGAGMILGYVPTDVIPKTAAETVLTIVLMFFGFFMVMIFISATTSAIQSTDSKALLKGDRLDKMFRYLAYKGVPSDLIAKIIAFYEYQMTSSASLAQMEEFHSLPSSMYTQLTMELNRNVLRGCRLWTALPWEVVMPLMKELKPHAFPPGEVIVSEGKVSTGLHFIEQGTIEVLSKDARIALLLASDFFGEDSLLEMIEIHSPAGVIRTRGLIEIEETNARANFSGRRGEVFGEALPLDAPPARDRIPPLGRGEAVLAAGLRVAHRHVLERLAGVLLCHLPHARAHKAERRQAGAQPRVDGERKDPADGGC